MAQRVDLKRVAFDHGQATGVMFRHLGQRGQAAAVLLDRQHMTRAFSQQPTGEAAGPGADLQHVAIGHIPGLPRDLGREVQVQQKVLAEGLARGQFVGVDHLAQRREIVDCTHVFLPICHANLIASIMLVGLARPWPAMSKAVP